MQQILFEMQHVFPDAEQTVSKHQRNKGKGNTVLNNVQLGVGGA